AMPTARAADRDSQIDAIVASVVRKPARHEMIDVAIHPFRLGLAFKVLDDFRIDTALRGEFRLPIGIGQATDVEHEVGVERDAVLVPEGLEQQREPGRIHADEILDPQTQRRRRKLARIEAIAERSHVGESFALELDRLGERALLIRKRMPSARLGETLDQGLCLRIEIEKAYGPAVPARRRDRWR